MTTQFNAEVTFSATTEDVLQQLEKLTKASTEFSGSSAAAQEQLKNTISSTSDSIRNLQNRLVELYAQRAKGDQTEALQGEIKATEKAVLALQGDLKQMQSVMPQVGASGAQMGAQATGGILQMAEAFGLAQISVKALTSIFDEVTEGLKKFVEIGFEFNKTIETAQIGIGALIATQNQITGADGKALEGQEKLTAGMALGEEQVKKLRLASFATVATFEQLVKAYQQGLGPMQQAGVELDKTVQMTQRFAQAAGALGLDINTLGHELRATFGGQISPRIARIASSLHIKNEDIQAWSKAGTLVDEMNKRLEFFGLAGDKVEASWQGITSNIKHFTEAFSGEAIQPLFDELKTGLHEALHDAFDMSTGDFSEAFQGLLTAGKDVFREIGEAAKDALKWAVDKTKELSVWFKENREDVLRLVQDIRIVGTQIAGILGDIIGISTETAGLFGPLKALNVLFEGIGLVVAAIRDGITILEAGIISAATILAHGILGPVQAALLGIAAAMDFVKKGSGEALAGVAENLQSFLDTGYNAANNLVQPFKDGKNAIAAYGDALLDADEKLAHLTDTDNKQALTIDQKKALLKSLAKQIKEVDAEQAKALASEKTATIAGTQEIEARARRLTSLHDQAAKVSAELGQYKTKAIKDPAGPGDPNTQDETALKIKELLASTSEKASLAQKEEAETQAFLNRIRHEEIQINKEAEKKEGGISAADKARDLKALAEAKVQGLANIQKKYEDQRALDETSLHLKELLAGTIQKVSLAQKEEAETQAFLNKVKAEENRITRESSTRDKDLEALKETKLNGLANIGAKYAALEIEAQRKLNDHLLVEEGRGFQAQIAQVHEKYQKMRADAKAFGADQATMERINKDELASISNAYVQRVDSDIQRLRKALTELQKEKGSALTFQEQIAEIKRFGEANHLTQASIKQVTTEITRQQDAMNGWNAGLQQFVDRGRNLFETFKSAALQVFQGIQSSFQRAIDGMLSGTMRVGEAMKSVWKGISQAVISALAGIAAQYITTAVAASVLGATQTTVASTTASASSTAAAAEIWEAWAPLSLVGGEFAALAEIATMVASIKGAGIVAHAQGGVIDRPMLALLGEGSDHEIVANETSFRDWGNDVLNMGATLARANMSTQRTTEHYNNLGASYATAAAHQGPSSPGKASTDGGDHYHFEGSTIMGTSVESMRVVGRQQRRAQREWGWRNG